VKSVPVFQFNSVGPYRKKNGKPSFRNLDLWKAKTKILIY